MVCREDRTRACPRHDREKSGSCSAAHLNSVGSGIPRCRSEPRPQCSAPKVQKCADQISFDRRCKASVEGGGESSNPQLQNIIGLLLLTGARKTELLRAQWQHIDLERKSWHIPMTKTGVPRYVPLSQAALDIINELPRWDGCPWLLPNPLTRKPYADLKRPWDTARDAAGLADFHLHDLRHSAASFMINAGIDLYTV